MSSLAGADHLGQPAGISMSYERFAGGCAIFAGLVGFLYSIAFVIVRSDSLSAIFLMLGGLLGTSPWSPSTCVYAKRTPLLRCCPSSWGSPAPWVRQFMAASIYRMPSTHRQPSTWTC